MELAFEGDPILVDLNALWLRAAERAGQSVTDSRRRHEDAAERVLRTMQRRFDMMGEFAILSAWARRKPAAKR